ncbi:MAG: response regulator transcription factor [Saprospiraceae bacterium]|nr:response regulator transcription factor [Saprospiraceae bacterium]
MKCLIVDDNPMARTVLRQMATKVEWLEILGECETALETIRYLQQYEVDLLFLDVEMPDMNGLELLESLVRKPITILITSREEYAVKAFDVNVADYLVKPVGFARFMTAVQRAKELLDLQRKEPSTTNDYLFVRANNALTRVPFDQILFIQAMDDYVVIATALQKYLVHTTMKGIGEKLPEKSFCRVHRSYIVAIDKIDSIADNMIAIAKQVIPLSESYKPALMSRLNLL